MATANLQIANNFIILKVLIIECQFDLYIHCLDHGGNMMEYTILQFDQFFLISHDYMW